MQGRRRQLLAYVAAPVLIGVAVMARNALIGPAGEPEADLLLLAVALAGALGGWGPAVLATLVGLLEEAYLHAQPVGSFRVDDQRDLVELGIFLVSGFCIGVTFEILRRSLRKEAAIRRTLAMITRCNEAVLRATSESGLFADVCRVIVEVGGYRMCWVGLAEDDVRKTVRPVAHAGHEDGYLAVVDIVWADEPRGQGTTGTAIRERRMAVGQNFSSDPSLRAWRDEAHRRGYRSVTSLPMLIEGRVIGAIVMYAGAVRAFSSEELGLLKSLTDDVAFGVATLRQRAARDLAVEQEARASRALADQQARFQALIDHSTDVTAVIDRAGVIRFISPSAQDILGIAPSEFVGHRLTDFIHPEDHAQTAEKMRALVDGPMKPSRITLRVRRADGTWATLEARGTARLDDPAIHGIVVNCRDVTEHEQAAQTLRDREARLRAYFESPAVGIAITSPTKGWMDVNEHACALLGYSREELFDRTWLELTHPEDVAADVAQFDRVVAGEIERYSLDKRFIRKDGSTVWTLLSVSCVRRDDRTVDSFIAILNDINERVAAEKGRLALQAKLAASARLAAMGTLVAGVAHEVNNPLAALTASAGVAAEEVREFRDVLDRAAETDRRSLRARSDEILEMLEDVTSNSERIARIVKDLTILGKPEKGHRRINLGGVVQKAAFWTPTVVRGRATVRTEVVRVPDVMASESQMEQVLTNLISNAALAIPEAAHGEIVIRLGLGPPGRVRVEVSDNGPGIAADLLERIFEPFFTTRRQGKGTGLGLAICRAIVGSHAGTLTVESEVGKGATFTVELPAAPAEA